MLMNESCTDFKSEVTLYICNVSVYLQPPAVLVLTQFYLMDTDRHFKL